MSGLRYPGGKTRSVDLLEQFVPKHHTEFVSPFVGGGSFEIRLASRGSVKCYDIFQPLVTYWKWLLHVPSELATAVQRYTPVSPERFKELRSWMITHLQEDTIDVAATFFVLNRCSFSGTTLSGGYSAEAATKRFTQSSVDRIRTSDLKRITVECSNFATTLANPITQFIFVDPPYYTPTKLYGVNGEGQNIDHVLLRDLIIQSPDWIITYDDCPAIRQLYANFAIVEVAWAYGMNSTKKSNEIIIISENVLMDLWIEGKMMFGDVKLI